MVGDTIEGTRAGGRFRRRGYAARWGLLAAVGAVVAAAAAGCTSTTGGPGTTTAVGTGSSTVSPTTSPSASVTASLTSTYPADVPAEARANTPAGAVAFARHYFAQINKAYTTPQGGLIAPLSDGSCLSCASFANNADTYSKTGQRYSAEPLQVMDATLAKDSSTGTMVDVVLKQKAAKLIDSIGTVVDTFSEKQGSFLVQLQRRSDGWVVQKIQARQ